MSAITLGFVTVAFPDVWSSYRLPIQTTALVAAAIVFNNRRSFVAGLPPGMRKPFTPDQFNVSLPVMGASLLSSVNKTADLLRGAVKEAVAEAAPVLFEMPGVPASYGPPLLAALGVLAIVGLFALALHWTGEAAAYPLRMAWCPVLLAVRYQDRDGTWHDSYPPVNARFLKIFLLLSGLSYLIAWGVSHLWPMP